MPIINHTWNNLAPSHCRSNRYQLLQDLLSKEECESLIDLMKKLPGRRGPAQLSWNVDEFGPRSWIYSFLVFDQCPKRKHRKIMLPPCFSIWGQRKGTIAWEASQGVCCVSRFFKSSKLNPRDGLSTFKALFNLPWKSSPTSSCCYSKCSRFPLIELSFFFEFDPSGQSGIYTPCIWSIVPYYSWHVSLRSLRRCLPIFSNDITSAATTTLRVKHHQCLSHHLIQYR